MSLASTFQEYLDQAPSAFLIAVDKCNELCVSKGSDEILDTLQHVTADDFSYEESRDLKPICICFKYVLAGVAQYDINDESTVIKALQEYTELSERFTQILAKAVCHSSSQSVFEFRYPRLRAIDWNLGFSVASSECANLNIPFISIVLEGTDEYGKNERNSVELDIKDFKYLLVHVNKAVEASRNSEIQKCDA